LHSRTGGSSITRSGTGGSEPVVMDLFAALQPFAAKLADAEDFVAVGTLVCDVNRGFGVYQTALSLFAPEGRPLVSVDDMPNVTDALRVHFFEESWKTLAPELRANHLPIAYSVDRLDMYLLPLLEPAGVIGAMMSGTKNGYTDDLRQMLGTVAHYTSVRLAQLGVRHRDDRIASSLTTRQLDVAQLAAQGRTNLEIAVALGVTENTIKKHLKDVFDRLDILTRTELVTMLAHEAPKERVPIGVTHRGHITITRAA
jgi:DNA-binding CsgD family transcriptional regulator